MNQVLELNKKIHAFFYSREESSGLVCTEALHEIWEFPEDADPIYITLSTEKHKDCIEIPAGTYPNMIKVDGKWYHPLVSAIQILHDFKYLNSVEGAIYISLDYEEES